MAATMVAVVAVATEDTKAIASVTKRQTTTKVIHDRGKRALQSKKSLIIIYLLITSKSHELPPWNRIRDSLHDNLLIIPLSYRCRP